MCKFLADFEKKRVVVVDTSNEIAGDGDVPHMGIGKARRMQVAHPSIQHEVMIEAVENHMPEVIVIDEIGNLFDIRLIRTFRQRNAGRMCSGTNDFSTRCSTHRNSTWSSVCSRFRSLNLNV